MNSRLDPRPCVNTDDLLAWEPPGGAARPEVIEDMDDVDLPPNPTGVPTIEKLRPGRNAKFNPQLIVVHDCKGDFRLCDRWEGCLISDCKPFLFTHWWHIDKFCYFGHKLVNIPPPAFTSLAHRHGVAVMGTLAFRHDSGKEALSSILSAENFLVTIFQLVEIMKTWQFEGWLVNLSESVLLEDVELWSLTQFMITLKKAIKAANPRASLLWYNETKGVGVAPRPHTNREQACYHACDGIFTWKTFHDDIVATNDKGSVASLYKIVNVPDGDARWNCLEAVQLALRKRKTSVALLAPGWAVEGPENAGADAEESSYRFWSTLAPVMNSRPLDFFPFKTTFRNGISQNGNFFRLRDMDLMPNLALSREQLISTEHGLLIKNPGKYLLWHVKMRFNPDLRVKIKVEDGGSVRIKLDRHEMIQHRYVAEPEGGDDVENAIELRPDAKQWNWEVKTIFVVTTQPDIVLSYFSAYFVPTKYCLR